MNWVYIAGFFDGEGHISRRKHNKAMYYTCVTQATPRREVLDRIATFLNSSGIPVTFAIKEPCPSHPAGHTFLYVRGFRNVYNFLSPLLPHLIVKHAEAVVMLAACADAIAREDDHQRRIQLAADDYARGITLQEVMKLYRITDKSLYPLLRQRGIKIRSRNEAIRAHFRLVG